MEQWEQIGQRENGPQAAGERAAGEQAVGGRRSSSLAALLSLPPSKGRCPGGQAQALLPVGNGAILKSIPGPG